MKRVDILWIAFQMYIPLLFPLFFIWSVGLCLFRVLTCPSWVSSFLCPHLYSFSWRQNSTRWSPSQCVLSSVGSITFPMDFSKERERRHCFRSVFLLYYFWDERLLLAGNDNMRLQTKRTAWEKKKISSSTSSLCLNPYRPSHLSFLLLYFLSLMLHQRRQRVIHIRSMFSRWMCLRL